MTTGNTPIYARRDPLLNTVQIVDSVTLPDGRNALLTTAVATEPETTDLVRETLVVFGLNATDLAAYDAAAEGTPVHVTSITTVAQAAALRAALTTLSGAHTIGVTNTEFDNVASRPPIPRANRLLGPSVMANTKLNKDATAALVMVGVPTSFSGTCIMEPRRGTLAYTTVPATNLTNTFNSWTGELQATVTVGSECAVWLIKAPTEFAAADCNVAMFAGTSMTLVAGTTGYQFGDVGVRTALTTTSTSTSVSQWQIVAVDSTNWASATPPIDLGPTNALLTQISNQLGDVASDVAPLSAQLTTINETLLALDTGGGSTKTDDSLKFEYPPHHTWILPDHYIVNYHEVTFVDGILTGNGILREITNPYN